MELFSQYQPLFADAINNNSIGVCKWIESGTTIDTALPELRNLTDDKDEWRAVIIRYVDDNSMSSFESDPRNPFDFVVNKGTCEKVEESPIPLVRLTQMLGGVPPLEVKFRPEIIREAHKAPRTVYVPIEDKFQEDEYNRLVEQYSFDGKLPSAILLISVRNNMTRYENIGRAWVPHKESDSSEFWKRNRFPSICRFLTFDYKNQGPIQRDADDFKFWYSVMLLALNEWDSSTIQAYRLYTLSLELDNESIEDSFQMLADRLRDAKHGLERSIKKDIESEVSAEEQLPDYRINVTVSPKLPDTKNTVVKDGAFGFFSKGASSDIAIWSRQKTEAEEKYATAVKTSERKLDQSAERLRAVCAYSEDEVFPLNKYQIEDLTKETNDLYYRVMDIRSILPKGSITNDEEATAASKKVRQNLIGRVMLKPAARAIGIIALLAVLCLLPSIITEHGINEAGGIALASILAAAILIPLLVGFFALVVQRLKLSGLIKAYNQYLHNAFNKLVNTADDYSAYLTSIASHSRGSSYLQLTKRIKHNSDATHFSKYKHIKAINILLAKLQAWSKALRVNVDFTSRRSESRVDINTTIAPMENKLYLFDTSSDNQVAINNSGMFMTSPYGFAKRIRIVREELYENE